MADLKLFKNSGILANINLKLGVILTESEQIKAWVRYF